MGNGGLLLANLWDLMDLPEQNKQLEMNREPILLLSCIGIIQGIQLLRVSEPGQNIKRLHRAHPTFSVGKLYCPRISSLI